MKTSDLHSRMYPMPLRTMNQQQQMLMQKLRSMPDSPTTGTSAPNAPSCNASARTFSYSLDPYMPRDYWLLRNEHGQFLTGMQGTTLFWSSNPNDVPHELRHCHEGALLLWARLREVIPEQEFAVAIRPITFYAHRSTPHLWSAADVQP